MWMDIEYSKNHENEHFVRWKLIITARLSVSLLRFVFTLNALISSRCTTDNGHGPGHPYWTAVFRISFTNRSLLFHRSITSWRLIDVLTFLLLLPQLIVLYKLQYARIAKCEHQKRKYAFVQTTDILHMWISKRTIFFFCFIFLERCDWHWRETWAYVKSLCNGCLDFLVNGIEQRNRICAINAHYCRRRCSRCSLQFQVATELFIMIISDNVNNERDAIWIWKQTKYSSKFVIDWLKHAAATMTLGSHDMTYRLQIVECRWIAIH